MATTRTQKAKQAEEPQEPKEAKETQPADTTPDATEKGLPKDEPKDATKGKKVIKIQNLHPRFFYVHPATGTRIGPGQVRELPQDSWLDMFIESGIFKEL